MADRILIVDDEPDNLTTTAARLKASGYEVAAARNYTEAFDLIGAKNPNLILLDVMMPGVDGFEMKNRLNKDTFTAGIPVIFLTAKDTVSDKIKGFSLGIDDYIVRPYDAEELLARVASVLNRRKFYEEVSMTDGLTGLHNINFFNKQLRIFFTIAKRYKQVFCLAVIDVDDLKKINDTYGHIAGDGVLKNFASAAKKVFRESDIITRYGGDEFTVILPGVNKEQAGRAMERLRDEIRKEAFSISIGIAEYKDSLKNEEELFKAADSMLYEDKKAKKTRQNPHSVI